MPNLGKAKKGLFLIFVLTILLLSSAKTVNSQTASPAISPLEQARQDYAFQTTKYQEKKAAYNDAKTTYLAFKTAAAKNDAFIKTQEYIVQIHNIYITYLFLINERSNQYDWGKGPYNKDDEHKIILDEVKALENLRTEAEKLTTLEDVQAHAGKLTGQLETSTLPKIYKLHVKTDLSQILEVGFDFDQSAQKMDEFVSPKIPENNKQIYLNWKSKLEETKGRIKTQGEAKKLEIDKIGNKRMDFEDPEFEFTTANERRTFGTTTDLLKEILTYI